MRKIYRTEAFDEFFESLPDNVKEKVRYLLFMITEVKVVNTKVVKNLLIRIFMNCVYLSATSIGRFFLR